MFWKVFKIYVVYYDSVVEIFGVRCNEIIYIFVIIGIVKNDFIIYNVNVNIYLVCFY